MGAMLILGPIASPFAPLTRGTSCVKCCCMVPHMMFIVPLLAVNVVQDLFWRLVSDAAYALLPHWWWRQLANSVLIWNCVAWYCIYCCFFLILTRSIVVYISFLDSSDSKETGVNTLAMTCLRLYHRLPLWRPYPWLADLRELLRDAQTRSVFAPLLEPCIALTPPSTGEEHK